MSLTKYFKKRQGALVCNLPPHEEINATNEEVLKLVKDSRAIFARYTTDKSIGKAINNVNADNSGWWYCVKEEPISLEKLSAKQRYRIKKGLKANRIFRATVEYIKTNREFIFDSFKASISDYPSEYRENIQKESLFSWLIPASQKMNSDVWIVEDISSNDIIGFAHCRLSNNMVDMSSVKLNPAYFKNEVNAALVYEICHYYLNEKGFSYICDGERNIRHQTEYQDFLVRVLGFRKSMCKLNIVYHPVIKPIVYSLYPFRYIIGKISKGHRHIYDIYCILMQEQYSRESKTFFREKQDGK